MEKSDIETWEASANLVQISLTEDIRPALIRQEESIIFALIERSGFPLNQKVYDNRGDKLSLLDYMLSETEKLHSSLGRFDCEEEHPFFPEFLSDNILDTRRHENRLKPNKININAQIKSVYLSHIVTELCKKNPVIDEKNNYGSTSMLDINVLQAISRRIHYGKFVAEAKFSANRNEFVPLIQNQDAKGLMQLLTHAEVENKVIERVLFKASHYGKDPTQKNEVVYHVQPELIAELYEKYLIPLNKEVQVQYLLNRLNLGNLVNDAVDSVNSLINSVLRNQFAFAKVQFGKEVQGMLYQDELNIFASETIEGIRFIKVGKPKCDLGNLREGLNRAALIFGLDDTSGALKNFLGCLEEFNLKVLETIEMKKMTESSQSLFYCEVDISGQPLEKIKIMLNLVDEASKYYRLCGLFFASN